MIKPLATLFVLLTAFFPSSPASAQSWQQLHTQALEHNWYWHGGGHYGGHWCYLGHRHDYVLEEFHRRHPRPFWRRPEPEVILAPAPTSPPQVVFIQAPAPPPQVVFVQPAPLPPPAQTIVQQVVVEERAPNSDYNPRPQRQNYGQDIGQDERYDWSFDEVDKLYADFEEIEAALGLPVWRYKWNDDGKYAWKPEEASAVRGQIADVKAQLGLPSSQSLHAGAIHHWSPSERQELADRLRQLRSEFRAYMENN